MPLASARLSSAFLLIFSAAPALADSAVATSSAASSRILPTPDVVRLANGGVLRGAITELVPGESVVIITGTGEVRRFAMADVVFAGAASAEPAAAAAPDATVPAVSADAPHRAVLSVSSNLAGVTVHRRTQMLSITAVTAFGGRTGLSQFGASAMEPLCRAPCELRLEPGTYYLGLSLNDRGPIEDPTPLEVTSRSTALVGTYTDWSKVRIAGGVVLVSSAVASVFALAVGLSAEPGQDCATGFCTSRRDLTPTIVGVSVGSVGMLAGLLLMLKSDDVEVDVR